MGWENLTRKLTKIQSEKDRGGNDEYSGRRHMQVCRRNLHVARASNSVF